MFLRYIFLLLLSCLFGNSFAQVVQKNSFDFQNQLTFIEYSKNGLRLVTVQFTFDKLGNRLSRTIGIAPFTLTRPFSLYGSYVSNAKIFHRATTDSIYRFVGTTDENAYTIGSFSGGLQLGDSLLILAGGYVPLRVPVSAELLTQTHHKLPLFTATLSTDIVNPSLRTNVTGSISTSPTISLQLNADRNLLKYIVVRKDSSLQEINATGLQTVNYDLREGKNFVKVYYVGNGTVRDSIEKEISYVPLAAITNPTENIAKITFACDTSKFKNVLIYAGNKFLGVISQPLTDIYATKQTLLSLHTFGFERDTLIAQNRNYTVNLQSLLHTNQQKTVQFPQTVQYPLPNISVQSTGIDSVVISKKYNVNYNPLGLISVIPTTYELTKLQANSPDQLAIRAVVDIPIPNFPTNPAFYYVGMWEDGNFKKIFAPQFPSRKLSIETAQQLINVDSISKTATNTKFSLFKSQAVGIMPNTDTLTVIAGREINKALRNYLVIDKDSIRNDLFTRISAISSGIFVTSNNDSIKVKASCNTGFFRFTSSFTHDSLTVTKTYVVKVLPIENIASPVLVSTNATCPENFVKLLIANSKTDLNYVVVDSATNSHLTGLTPRLHRGNGDTLSISISLQTTKTLLVQAQNHLEVGDTICKQIRTQKQRIIVYPKPDTLKNIYRNWCYLYKDSIALNNTNKVEISTSPSFTTFVTLGINAKFLPTHNANVARTTEIIYYIRPRTDKGCTLPAKRIIVRQNDELFRSPNDSTLCYGSPISYNFKKDSVNYTIISRNDTIRNGKLSYARLGSGYDVIIATHIGTNCAKRDTVNYTVLPPFTSNVIDLNNVSQNSYCSVNMPFMDILGSTVRGGDNKMFYIWQRKNKGANWVTVSSDSLKYRVSGITDTIWVRRIVATDTLKSQVRCESDTSNIVQINYVNPNYKVSFRGKEISGLENKYTFCRSEVDSLIITTANKEANISVNGEFKGKGRAVIHLDGISKNGNVTILVALAGCASLPTRINIVVEEPQISLVSPQSVYEICLNGTAEIRVNVDDLTAKYQWYRNGVLFTRNLSTEVGVLQTKEIGNYTCTKITKLGCSISTNPVKVEIITPPNLHYINRDGTRISGDTLRDCIGANNIFVGVNLPITTREITYRSMLAGRNVSNTSNILFDAIQGYNLLSGWMKLYIGVRINNGTVCEVLTDSIYIQRQQPLVPRLINVPLMSCGKPFTIIGNLANDGDLVLSTTTGTKYLGKGNNGTYTITETLPGSYLLVYRYKNGATCYFPNGASDTKTFKIPVPPTTNDFSFDKNCDKLVITRSNSNGCPLIYQVVEKATENVYQSFNETIDNTLMIPLKNNFGMYLKVINPLTGQVFFDMDIPVNLTDTSVAENCLNVSVFPNPNDGIVRIGITENGNLCNPQVYLENIPYIITDAIGKKFTSGVLTNFDDTINLQQVASGVYFITLNVRNTTCTKSFIISR